MGPHPRAGDEKYLYDYSFQSRQDSESIEAEESKDTIFDEKADSSEPLS